MALKNGSDRRWGILSKKAILKKNVEKRKKNKVNVKNSKQEKEEEKRVSRTQIIKKIFKCWILLLRNREPLNFEQKSDLNKHCA